MREQCVPGALPPFRERRGRGYVCVFACKLKALANSRGSYPLADMETSDNTLDQVSRTASSSDRLAVLALDSINSTYTYYNTANKRILITANKRIHIISAYFLAAASDKHMRLLTRLYGNICADIFPQSTINILRFVCRTPPTTPHGQPLTEGKGLVVEPGLHAQWRVE